MRTGITGQKSNVMQEFQQLNSCCCRTNQPIRLDNKQDYHFIYVTAKDKVPKLDNNTCANYTMPLCWLQIHLGSVEFGYQMVLIMMHNNGIILLLLLLLLLKN